MVNRTSTSAIRRGLADEQVPLFHGFSVEDRMRPDHPLRDINRRIYRILSGMSARFAKACSRALL